MDRDKENKDKLLHVMCPSMLDLDRKYRKKKNESSRTNTYVIEKEDLF